MMKKARACELCGGGVALYCPSDSAFLCSNCDDEVHRANFLVARHLRFVVCSNCQLLTADRVSGFGFRRLRSICRSCSHVSLSSSSSVSSSTSDCISSAESCVTPQNRVDRNNRKINRAVSSAEISNETNLPETTVRRGRGTKGEEILVNWCKKLGVSDHVCEVTMPLAIEAFRVCSSELTVLPLRVSLVASLWFSLRLCGDMSASTWQVLKRLGELSGVPWKLTLASESKLGRIYRRRQKSLHEEEGWAECSV